MKVESLVFIVSLALILLASCVSQAPALEVVLDEHPDLGSGVYEKLSRWQSVLGEPETVPQADHGHTFFYWPKHGVAVFTHPLYEGQGRGKERPERKVTSVILPLQKELEPEFLPVEEGVLVHFDRLLEVDEGRYSPEELIQEPDSKGCHTIDTISSPSRKTTERIHVCDGEAVALEVRDTWWLSHYD